MSDTAVLMMAIAGLWLLAATGAPDWIVPAAALGIFAVVIGVMILATRNPKH